MFILVLFAQIYPKLLACQPTIILFVLIVEENRGRKLSSNNKPEDLTEEMYLGEETREAS